MPFDINNLRRCGYGAALAQNAPPVSTHSYVTADAAATVEAAGYFNAGTKHLAKGDKIEARMAMTGTPVLKEYIVTNASGAAVVVVALQAPAAG